MQLFTVYSRGIQRASQQTKQMLLLKPLVILLKNNEDQMDTQPIKEHTDDTRKVLCPQGTAMNMHSESLARLPNLAWQPDFLVEY